MSKSGLFAHFRSKEQLQLQTLDHAVSRFTDVVVRPTLKAPRGESRVRELFERWLDWETDSLAGGCVFATAAIEYDDQPGEMHDALVRQQRDWTEFIATVAGTARLGGRVPLRSRREAVRLLAAVPDVRLPPRRAAAARPRGARPHPRRLRAAARLVPLDTATTHPRSPHVTSSEKHDRSFSEPGAARTVPVGRPGRPEPRRADRARHLVHGPAAACRPRDSRRVASRSRSSRSAPWSAGTSGAPGPWCTWCTDGAAEAHSSRRSSSPCWPAASAS